MQSRRHFLKSAGALAALITALMSVSNARAARSQTPQVIVYRLPSCGCCEKWVDHLRESGFSVNIESREDLQQIKTQLGIPDDLQSCHTALVDGYVIEGHVPAEDIHKLLETRPNAKGLAVPGMPVGSPGMEMGTHKDPYQVILFGAEKRSVFAIH